LRDCFKLTDVRMLQYGFTYQSDNIHIPHNYIQNCIAYTSTHDTLTGIGWWKHHASDDEKRKFLNYISLSQMYDVSVGVAEKKHNQDVVLSYLNGHINWFLIQLLLETVADTTIIQFQDLLGLDNESRMNDPSLCK